MGLARFSEDLPDEASDRIGFFAPSLALVALASEVFASPGAREAGCFPDHPLVTFRSPPEYDRLGAVSCRTAPADDCLPCGFFPFDACRSGQPHTSRRRTTLRVKVPSQRFDALKAFICPRPAGLVSCRQRPWGFALQGLHAGKVEHPFGCRCPPVVGRGLHFRACYLAGAREPCRGLNRQRTLPLMGFALPRGCALATGSPDGAFPLLSFVVAPCGMPRVLFRVLPATRKVGLLRVRPPLARFFTLLRPRNSRSVASWVTPRRRWMLPSNLTPIRTSRPLPELPGTPFR